MTTDTTHADRPLVTFALFAYNQEVYIREAVAGALAQTYEPLEIILSDDCSTDRTFEIMQEIASAYTGPHRVALRRNERNLGLPGHVNAIFEIASGDYIVAAAGDDISEPNRVEALLATPREQPMLVHSKCIFINEDGEQTLHKQPEIHLGNGNIKNLARSRGLYIGATGMWHKDLIKIFGPISHSKAYEDLVFGYRAALAGRVAFVDEPLVRYRVGSGMTTMSAASVVRKHEAALASLQQRRDDTLSFAPTCAGVLRSIDHQIVVERAILLFYLDRKRLVLEGHFLKWPVITFILAAAFRRSRRALFDRL